MFKFLHLPHGPSKRVLDIARIQVPAEIDLREMRRKSRALDEAIERALKAHFQEKKQ